MCDISRLFVTIRTNAYIRHFYISIVRFRQRINASARRLVAHFFALRKYHKMHFRLCGMKGRPARGIRFYGTTQPFRHICPNHSFGE